MNLEPTSIFSLSAISMNTSNLQSLSPDIFTRQTNLSSNWQIQHSDVAFVVKNAFTTVRFFGPIIFTSTMPNKADR